MSRRRRWSELKTQILGTGLALALLVLLVLGVWWTRRHPFVGLGLLVAGMAFHSFLLMLLLRLETPTLLVRAFQGWKEVLLALLTVIAALRVYDRARSGQLGPILLTDWIAGAFAMLAVVYVEAWRQTQNPNYGKVARGILDFVLREMTGPQGAFYTAFDAEVDA